MGSTRPVNAEMGRKGLLFAGIVALIGALLTAPESHPPASFPLRIALVLGCMLAVVLIPVSSQRWHTLWLWASIGATMGFGLGGVFGIGPIGLIPFVLVIGYAILSCHELDYGLNLVGGIVSAMFFVIIAVPVERII